MNFWWVNMGMLCAFMSSLEEVIHKNSIIQVYLPHPSWPHDRKWVLYDQAQLWKLSTKPYLVWFWLIRHNVSHSHLQHLQGFILPKVISVRILCWQGNSKDTRAIIHYEAVKDTLMADASDNPLFCIGTR